MQNIRIEFEDKNTGKYEMKASDTVLGVKGRGGCARLEIEKPGAEAEAGSSLRLKVFSGKYFDVKLLDTVVSDNGIFVLDGLYSHHESVYIVFSFERQGYKKDSEGKLFYYKDSLSCPCQSDAGGASNTDEVFTVDPVGESPSLPAETQTEVNRNIKEELNQRVLKRVISEEDCFVDSRIENLGAKAGIAVSSTHEPIPDTGDREHVLSSVSVSLDGCQISVSSQAIDGDNQSIGNKTVSLIVDTDGAAIRKTRDGIYGEAAETYARVATVEDIPLDAPADGKQYARKDGDWDEVTPDAPVDGKQYARKDGDWDEVTPDAPVDGKQYVRKNGQWHELKAEEKLELLDGPIVMERFLEQNSGYYRFNLGDKADLIEEGDTLRVTYKAMTNFDFALMFFGLAENGIFHKSKLDDFIVEFKVKEVFSIDNPAFSEIPEGSVPKVAFGWSLPNLPLQILMPISAGIGCVFYSMNDCSWEVPLDGNYERFPVTLSKGDIIINCAISWSDIDVPQAYFTFTDFKGQETTSLLEIDLMKVELIKAQNN